MCLKWLESGYLQPDSGVTVVFKWWSGLWLHVCQLTDAVLSLLEQPLNLLGVNGFMKPGEGGRERTRHDCEEEGVEGCLMKEPAVTGEGMGGQEGGTPERFVGWCL